MSSSPERSIHTNVVIQSTRMPTHNPINAKNTTKLQQRGQQTQLRHHANAYKRLQRITRNY